MALIKGKNHQLFIGTALIIIIIIVIAITSLTRKFSIQLDMDHRLEQPSSAFLLGTDDLGRDLVNCTITGAGISLLIGFSVITISSVFGSIIGMISGLAGGLIDLIIMRIVDVILAFPGILLAIALASFFTPGITTLILVLSVSSWVGYARIVRGEVLKYKQKEFILAAKSMNASFFRIVFFHLLPFVLPLIIVQSSLDITGVILAESSLNFLGIGLDPEIPTLGQLIESGRSHIFDNQLLVMVPGILLLFIIVAFNFIGEGLRKKFTP